MNHQLLNVIWKQGQESHFFGNSCKFCKQQLLQLVLVYESHFSIFSDKHPFKKKKKEVFWSHAAKLLKTLTTSRTFRKPVPLFACVQETTFVPFFFWWDFSFRFKSATCFSGIYWATAGKCCEAKLAELEPFSEDVLQIFVHLLPPRLQLYNCSVNSTWNFTDSQHT